MRVFGTNTGKLAIECSMRDVGDVRRIPGVRWNPKHRVWVANPTRLVKQFIAENLKVQVDPSAAKLMEIKPSKYIKMPVELVYDTKTVPYLHQREATQHTASIDVAALFMEQGTGKTKVVIDAIGINHNKGTCDSVLVVCPTTVMRVWQQQFVDHCPVEGYSLAIANHMTPKQFEAWMDKDAPLKVLVIGVQSVVHKAGKMAHAFLQKHCSCAMVVDESHTIKNPSAQRTKRVIELGQLARFRYILTGTPIANNIQDLYSQFEFLDTEIIGAGNWWAFRDRYCVYGGFEGRQIVGFQNTQELLNLIKPFVFRVTKEECLSLPPKVYSKVYVELSPEQQKVYKEIDKNMQYDTLDIKSAIEKMLRLQQVVGGFVGSGEDFREIKGERPKLNALDEIIEEAPGAVIIWCSYRYEVQQVVAHLHKKYGLGEVVEIHGGIDEANRARAVEAIQTGKSRFIVGTAASGGTGITLTKATTMVYYSNTFNYVDRVQSEDRFHRIGQTNSVTIYDIVAEKTVDEDVVEALNSKQDVASWVGKKLTEKDTK